jgi:hypothetical protein
VKPLHIILSLALLGGVFVMTLDYLALRDFKASAISEQIGSSVAPPWGGYAQRALARNSASLWGTDADGVSDTLIQTIHRYPLDARYWLNLARIEASLNGADSILLGPHLEAAVAIQPLNRDVRWRASQIALQSGNNELAEHHLQQWLVDAPSNTQQALMIARRWLTDPEQLIDRLLPHGEAFLVQTMRFARQQRDERLAQAAWQRLESDLDLNHPALLGYVDFLLDSGRFDQAVAIWEAHDPHFRTGGIANGDFSRPLGSSSGLNWRVNALPAGVRLTRDESDFHYSPASLRVEFTGDQNVSTRTPWIRVPVKPGERYEMTGWWRGHRLTTRALPYLWITSEGRGLNERLPIPSHTFDWEPWSVRFSVPEDVHMIRLRVRRDSTTAFDRNIAGQLWLDGIKLREMEPATEPAGSVLELTSR